MDEIASLAAQELDSYDTDEDKVDAFGTNDVRELAKKMTRCDRNTYIECEDKSGIRTQFQIIKYSLEYIK